MAPSRRSSDDEEADYTRVRGGVMAKLNGHTKWVVGAVSAAILFLAGGYVNDAIAQIRKSTEVNQRQDVDIATMHIVLERIDKNVEELKAKR